MPWLALARGGDDRQQALERAVGARSARAWPSSCANRAGASSNLSVKERTELRKLAGKLDLKGMGRELLAAVRGGAQAPRRKRR